jgi:PBSX family phage terminase large subunit
MNLTEIIAPSFYNLHKDIKEGRHTEYWLKGGRGSTKSSFISIEIILRMMRDKDANAVAIKKVKETCRESVFEQLIWAIEKLGVMQFWSVKVNPLTLTYLPTGQRIVFRGVDDPKKVKSGKLSTGYFKYIWYEELDEFAGPEEIRAVNQTFMRGGPKFVVFYSYNPPMSVKSWVNMESEVPKESRLCHHSTYLDVPRDWLGEAFIVEAEHLKKVKPRSYEHEYLGEVTGTGGEVFSNVKLREITDDEIARFDTVYRGIDWGYAVDPFAYGVMHYDSRRRRLYSFHEVYEVGLSNRRAAKKIACENVLNGWITADSAEPKSIDEMRDYGLKVRAARKGAGSIEFGIKWLCDLEEIVVDPTRCPNTAREFLNYELKKDRDGSFISRYPDEDNHTIDMVRYALEDVFKRENFSFS